MRLKITNMMCEEVNPEIIPKYKCVLRPTRDRMGSMTILAYNVSKMDDIWMNFRVYQKHGYTFQLVSKDYDIDWCLWMNEIKSGRANVIGRVMGSIAKVQRCPYQGTLGAENLNVSYIGEWLIPIVAPNKAYKFFARFYSKKDNVTILVFNVIGESEAITVESYLEGFNYGQSVRSRGYSIN